MGSRWWQAVLLVAGLLALSGGTAALSGFDAAQADRIRAQAQRDADERMARAGFAWVHITIDDATAWVVGVAPDRRQHLAALETARRELAPMMGVPGVFARLRDGMSERAPVSSDAGEGP